MWELFHWSSSYIRYKGFVQQPYGKISLSTSSLDFFYCNIENVS